VPFATITPDWPSFKDIASAAGVIGPLTLTVSLTLASIFYSVGDWYDAAQRFKLLGITNARPDRHGRMPDRAKHWGDVLRSTTGRIVISGTTLGGWFVVGWEDTREGLLEILGRGAQVQVLLAAPGSVGFRVRAEDPGEVAEAERGQKAPRRAQQVYECIQTIFGDPAFSQYIDSRRLSFSIYQATPLSVVWVDDAIYFTPYLPCVSDKACPEFSINRAGQMGATITNSIQQLIVKATKIDTAEEAANLAAACVSPDAN